MPESGIYIFYCREDGEGYANAWNLLIRRESTEEDLEENHHLEEVGEPILEALLEISHCPFCGEQLSNGKSSQYGNYLHRDYSEWSMKVL
ncbi:MAG: hypothetical protein P8163_06085 [Candidatus Thiodiazotropha sp.]